MIIDLHDCIHEKTESCISSAYSRGAILVNLRKRLEKASWLFPEIDSDRYPQFYYSIFGATAWMSNTIVAELTIPWDKDLADNLIQDFLDRGWTIISEKDYKEAFAEYYFYLQHEELGDSLNVKINMCARTQGSKCEVVTHKETRTHSSYEVICTETYQDI